MPSLIIGLPLFGSPRVASPAATRAGAGRHDSGAETQAATRLRAREGSTLSDDEHAPRRGCVGIIANPMAGRDVRRLAARASEVTHQAKRDAVARIAAGADAAGVERLLVHEEPFRISTGAIESMELGAERVVLAADGIRNGEADTAQAVQAMRDAGADVIVVLGGDGTSRCVARQWPDVPLVPVSTGTNNVFPRMVEPTLAGAAAGLVASGAVPLDAVSRPAKLVRIRAPGAQEAIALVDAVLLREDFVGNRMPFDPARIDRVLLTIASPAAVGISPIGGLVEAVARDEADGLLVHCNGGEGDRRVHVPISPGLYRDVGVASAHRIAPGVTVLFEGPGVIAMDGDREIRLDAGDTARLSIEHAGPRVIDVEAALFRAAQARAFG